MMRKELFLKQLTETSFILQNRVGDRIALVTKKDKILSVIGFEKTLFNDIDDLSKYLNSVITVQELAMNDSEDDSDIENSKVLGFPSKHKNHFDINSTPVPNYLKKENSSIRYVAGYYGLLFANGWAPSFCPKLSTFKVWSATVTS